MNKNNGTNSIRNWSTVEQEQERELEQEQERELERELDRELERELDRELDREQERELEREQEREQERELEQEQEQERLSFYTLFIDMKSTKQITEEMEKQFDCMNERTAGCICKGKMYEQVDCGVHGIYAVKAKSFIHSYTRTLLESFGEEIIGEDEKENRTLKQGIDYDIHKLLDFGLEIARIGGKNNLRAEQRLKVKEIISSIGK